jgi:hypothetical protein
MIKAMLFGRFEPVETTIAASSFIHGLIIMVYLTLSDKSIFVVSPTIEFFTAIILMIFGGTWFASICIPRITIRKNSALGQFAAWTMLSVLLLLSPNFHWLVHVGYVSISLVAAFLYLSLALGENHG